MIMVYIGVLSIYNNQLIIIYVYWRGHASNKDLHDQATDFTECHSCDITTG